jgi:hypothetical protein
MKKGANDWANLIAGVVNSDEDEVPEGFKTMQKISEETNIPIRTLSAKISRLVKKGKAEARKFRIKTPTKVYLTPHYRIIK